MTQLPFTAEITPDNANDAERPPDRIRQMWRMYGMCIGYTCAQCQHLVTHTQSRHWFKCDLTRQSASEATDWRKKWTACGQFQQRGE